MMLIGTLALTGVGIPHLVGFAGFHSKDAIIEAAFAAHTPNNYAFWLLVIAAFMTAFYSWRLMFMTFHGTTRADHETYEHAHESPLVMLVPLAAAGARRGRRRLRLPALLHRRRLQGVLGQGAVRGPGQPHPARHARGPGLGRLGAVRGDAGGLRAWPTSTTSPRRRCRRATARAFRPLYLFLLNKWYFDELYDWLFVRPAFWLGRVLWKGGDGAIIDGLGPTASPARVLWTTGRVVKLQTGYVYHYAFAMLIGVALIITWFMFYGGAVR